MLIRFHVCLIYLNRYPKTSSPIMWSEPASAEGVIVNARGAMIIRNFKRNDAGMLVILNIVCYVSIGIYYNTCLEYSIYNLKLYYVILLLKKFLEYTFFCSLKSLIFTSNIYKLF